MRTDEPNFYVVYEYSFFWGDAASRQTQAISALYEEFG